MVGEIHKLAGEAEVANVFIAKGCERRTHALDWSYRLDRAVYASAGDICIGTLEVSSLFIRIGYYLLFL